MHPCISPDTQEKALLRSRITSSTAEAIMCDLNFKDSAEVELYAQVCSALGLDTLRKPSLQMLTVQLSSVPFWSHKLHADPCSCLYSRPSTHILIFTLSHSHIVQKKQIWFIFKRKETHLPSYSCLNELQNTMQEKPSLNDIRTISPRSIV